MSRARGQKQYIALTKGLITEASPLAAPEGSTSDELNMDLQVRGGIRKRRKGLQKLISDLSSSGAITNSFHWVTGNYIVITAISDSPDTDLDTVTLHFHNASDFSREYSYQFQVLEDTDTVPSFAEIRNRLVVSFGASPFLFRKHPDDTLSAWRIELYVRDFKLVEDNLSIGTNPNSLSDEHEYNLINAGWWKERLIYDGSLTVPENPITNYFEEFSEYPSNADIPYLGDIPNDFGIQTFSAAAMTSIDVGNSEAPRGHYVYNIRNIDRQDKLTDRDDDGTPSTTLELLLDEGTNVSGNPGNLLFIDAEPAGGAGEPSDPYIRPFPPTYDGQIVP